VELRW